MEPPKTPNLTKILSAIGAGHNVITLSGDLGAGKTTLAKYLLKNFDINQEEVTSPTFNILNIYDSKDFQIWHYDLYRLKSSEEVFNLNYEEALEQKLVLIEWPEIIKKYLPRKRIDITIKILDNSEREYNFKIHP